MTPLNTLAALTLAATTTLATAGPRDVQFRSVRLETGLVQIANYGATPVDMTGWRFCSHDFDEARRYSGSTPFDGFVIEPNQTIVIHMNNDKPANAPGSFNASDFGGSFASPITTSPAYALELFYPNGGSLTFGSTDDMVDHIQWALDPENVGSATTRSSQAVAAGIWTDADAFVQISSTDDAIFLADVDYSELHGPEDYALNAGPCPVDFNGDGLYDGGDIGAFVQLFLSGDAAADVNNDGILDNGDISEFVFFFISGFFCY